MQRSSVTQNPQAREDPSVSKASKGVTLNPQANVFTPVTPPGKNRQAQKYVGLTSAQKQKLQQMKKQIKTHKSNAEELNKCQTELKDLTDQAAILELGSQTGGKRKTKKSKGRKSTKKSKRRKSTKKSKNRKSKKRR